MLELLAVFAETPSPPADASAHDQVIDWLTVVVSLIAGLLGGVIGALITSRTQKKLARDSARAVASKALWNFQRAIKDFAAEAEGHEARDNSYFTKTTREHLETARQEAYPYRSYLGADYEHLVGRNWLGDYDPYGDPMAPVDDWFKWAKELEARLNVVFKHKEPKAPKEKETKES